MIKTKPGLSLGDVPKSNRKMLAFRSFIGTTTFFVYMRSVWLIPLSVMQSVLSTVPFWIAAIQMLFFWRESSLVPLACHDCRLYRHRYCEYIGTQWLIIHRFRTKSIRFNLGRDLFSNIGGWTGRYCALNRSIKANKCLARSIPLRMVIMFNDAANTAEWSYNQQKNAIHKPFHLDNCGLSARCIDLQLLLPECNDDLKPTWKSYSGCICGLLANVL